ncbi:unnamed protein product [Parajaminaea phylloscopi]
MGLIQTPIHAPDRNVDLRDRTAIVTGATAGLGLETAAQLVEEGLGTLVVAVRNTAKAEGCVAQIKQRAEAKGVKDPRIVVLKLDMEAYDSIPAFVHECRQVAPLVDLVVLNAGVGVMQYKQSPASHELSLQVNYLSNVLLLLQLLPLLDAAAAKRGQPSRVTWVGSVMHHKSAIGTKAQELTRPDASVLAHFDDPAQFKPLEVYNDVKFLCAAFFFALAPRLDASRVVLNMVCPGMVKTGMSDVLPWYMRIPLGVVQFFVARNVAQGGWLLTHAAIEAGPDTHGVFLADRKDDGVDAFLSSEQGKVLQRRIYDETLAEMRRYMEVPAYLQPAQ